jgi:Transposase
MGEYSEAFVGIDVAKGRNATAIADGERGGEVRYLGEVDASPTSMTRIVRRLAEKYNRVQFCYEAGPTGYGLYRLITALGHDCAVVAPSLIPRRPGERVKTNRRDAVALAKLLRAGELTAVWVPDEGHEAMRDLVRARSAAVETLRVTSSRSAPSCSSMAGTIRARRPGACATCAGCRSSTSIIRRIKSCCRKCWKRSGLPKSGSSAWSRRSRSFSRPGRWRRSWKPSEPSRCRPDCRGHLRQRGR